jgi:prepilin-type N-terminal cleavage/methylation domain-containing protein
MKNNRGFTIIEVVLVLAIAGLIFLMVFLALPALQRLQRDHQRKQNLNALLDAYERCRSNNRGNCRNSGESATGMFSRLIRDYFPEEDSPVDPTTGEELTIYRGSYTNILGEGAVDVLSLGEVAFDWSAGCQDGKIFDDPGIGKMSKTAAFAIKLEGGGTYCVSNNSR